MRRKKKRKNKDPLIMEKSRIIICGPTGTGKTVLSKRFEERNFERNISYTSRERRKDEIDGQHYNFVSRHIFEDMIEKSELFEWTVYKGNYYGIGLSEWQEKDIFIMDRDGLGKLSTEERRKSFIIYLDVDKDLVIERLKKGRGWSEEVIKERLDHDRKKFSGFYEYDLKITNPNF